MQTMMSDKIWYPALNVAAHYGADFQNDLKPKKVEEMMAVAIAMAGVQEIQQRQYWIQGVLDSEQSPDVRTIYREERNDDKAPWCYQQDVEVVSYTEHSTDLTLAEFVAKTKLGSDKAYDDLTTILVNVQAGARLSSAHDWTTVLASTGKRNLVLVLGKIKPQKPHYRLAVVHPIVEGAFDYDVSVLLKKQGHTGVMKWSRGTKANHAKDTNEKHCPFEKFGVKCQLI